MLLSTFVALQLRLAALGERESGQTMAEYAVILGLIVAVSAAVFTVLGGNIKAAVQSVSSAI